MRLGHHYSYGFLELSLNPYAIEKVGGIIYHKDHVLNILIIKTEFPMPEVDLSGPSFFSTGCQNSALKLLASVSKGLGSNKVKYEWSSNDSPYNV